MDRAATSTGACTSARRRPTQGSGGDPPEAPRPALTDGSAVDASGDLVAAAGAKLAGRARFEHATFETVDVHEQFDAVFLIHTLEHLDDPVAVLRRVDRWLSARGRLFVVVPNANAPSR